MSFFNFGGQQQSSPQPGNANGNQPQGQQGQQPTDGQQPNQGQQPNASQQTDTNLNPWAKPANMDDKGGGSGSAPNSGSPSTGNENDGNAAASPMDTFNQFIDSINFMDGVDSNQLAKDMGMTEGLPESFQNALAAVGKNAFKQAMLTMNRVMDKRIESAIDTAVDKSTGQVNTDQAFTRMFEQLPFLAGEETQPVAKAVLSGFIKQGHPVNEAIAKTGKYFEEQTRAIAKHINMQAPRGNGQSQFSGEPNNPTEGSYAGFGNNANAPDWFDVLAGNQ